MEIEDANNPEPIEATELASEVVDEQDPAPEGDPPEDDGLEASEEEVEFDYNGKPLKLPKSIAEQLADVEETKKSIQRDATRKWQEAAEMRKAVETERETFMAQARMVDDLKDDFIEQRMVETRLQELQQVNFYQLSPEDQMRFVAEQNMLLQSRNQIGGRIQQKQQDLTRKQQESQYSHLQKAISELSKPDPETGWAGKFDKDVSDDLTGFLTDHNVPIEVARTINHPAMVKIINLAKIGKASLKQQRTTPARPLAASAAKVPTAKAQTVSADPAKWSVSQMAKHLKASKVI
jgi:hypothetical protein